MRERKQKIVGYLNVEDSHRVPAFSCGDSLELLLGERVCGFKSRRTPSGVCSSTVEHKKHSKRMFPGDFYA